MSAAAIPCASIDVGMIVYNERAIVGRTLDALLDVGFDSFVVLDMESSDGTVDFMRDKLGGKAKILSFPRGSLIESGYGEARNVCAAFGSREWLLFVDADEVLVTGVEGGSVSIETTGANGSLYSMERRNLAADPQRGPDAVAVASIEHHNRLYKPGLRLRYQGYIHEEIHAGDDSGWRDGGRTALVFDHYSSLKPVVDAEAKENLYALMLIRAYNQPDVRRGMNEWYFDHHVPTHIAALTVKAEVFAKQAGLPPSFYAVRPVLPTRGEMTKLVPCRVTSGDHPEAEFSLAEMRALHSAPCGTWLGAPSRAFWGEWDHPGEGSRTLTSIIESARDWHWERFVTPGKVAIDIGGHSGDTAIPMGLFSYDRKTGKKGTVVVIEPNPAVLPILNVNLAFNPHLADFYSLMAAVTETDVAEIELADHGNAQCNGGVLRNDKLSEETASKVLSAAGVIYKTAGTSMSTLFRNIREHISTDPIGFIKLDCEGYDKEILKPCRELFERDKPVLFVEWFDWFGPEDDEDLFRTIESIGYTAFEPVSMAPASVTRRVSDLLCLHKSVAHVASAA